MKRIISIFFVCHFFIQNGVAQQYVSLANQFIASLDAPQQARAIYPFESDERFNFHFFPKDNRKGLMFNEMTPAQKNAALSLMKSCISDNAIKKIGEIMSLETVLKEQEARKADDHTRDPGKYFITIFGVPGPDNVWGWRLEGHHMTFNFTSKNNTLISGTPGFLGSNPGIVQSGPQKGLQVLKEEADKGFHFLHTLSSAQLKLARVDTTAPAEIITFINRHAMDIKPAGINYKDLDPHQQQELLQLVHLYIDRYTKLLSDVMLKEIQKAGLENLSFAWAGNMQPEIGKPHYYRIQGPTIIIEYDNSQNNANHVHTVTRDLQNDFGDQLLQHYKTAH